MKVMIVEDSLSLTRGLEVMLRAAGHEVVEAANGFDALLSWKESDPDLIFMDIDMPFLDGYKATQIIRSHSDIPIYFLSSNSTIFDEARANLVGGSGFIAKPFTKESIYETLGRHQG